MTTPRPRTAAEAAHSLPAVQPTVVKAGRPADVLAAVPYELGFHPEHSLVLMSLRGPRERIGLVCRFDLPDPSTVASTCERAVRLLDHDQARSAFLVVYAAGGRTRGALPHTRLVRRLIARIERAGVEVKDALFVGTERYWSYRCTDSQCCPRGGRPVSDLADSPVGASFVAAGVAPAQRRADLRARLIPADPERACAVGELADVAHRRLASMDPVSALRETAATWRAALQADVTAAEFDEVAGELIGALQDTRLRDAVVTELVWDGAGASDEGPAAADRTAELLVALCLRADGPRAMAVLTLTALHAWRLGHGAQANIAVELALEISRRCGQDYPLAELLEDALAACVPPPGFEASWAAAEEVR